MQPPRHPRFLNQDRAPVLHPLKTSLGIDSYNHLWLGGAALPNPSASNRQPWVTDARNPHFPTVSELDAELGADFAARPPHAPTDESALPAPVTRRASPRPSLRTPPTQARSPAAMLASIIASRDRLFFVRYIAENTTNPRLHLVQASLENSANCTETRTYDQDGKYYCEFLAQFSKDVNRPWNLSRWRMCWHEYKRDHAGIIEYGARIEFPPRQTPNHDRYIAYADFLSLCDPNSFVFGPFNFADPEGPKGHRSSRDRLPPSIWPDALKCFEKSDVPIPPLEIETNQPSQPSRKRRRP